MQRRRHALLLERRDDGARSGHVRVVDAGRDHELRLAQRPEQPLVSEPRQEREQVHVIRVTLPRAVEPPRRVVRAGEADRAARDTGMARRERDRVERAERRAEQLEVRIGVLAPDGRHDLFGQVPVVREVAARALLGTDLLVVEGLAVHAVDAPELEQAFVDAGAEVPDHAEVLPLIEAAHRRGEDEHRRPAVAEYEELHVAAERRALPLAVVTLHFRCFRLCALRAASMTRHADFSSRHPRTTVSSDSSDLYVSKNVSISFCQCGARSFSVLIWSNRGSPTGTARIFSSSPFASLMNSVPIGRTGMTHPGNVGSSTMTTASSGSPSLPRVPITNP